MPHCHIATCHIVLSPAQITELYYSERVQHSDLAVFDEHENLLSYLPFDEAVTAVRNGEPWPSDSPKAQEDRKNWRQYGDEDLQDDMRHYRDWWRSKVEGGRGISVHRGKAQFLLRMALAGLPEWEAIWEMDGGWYQEDAYNAVAKLFGWETVIGSRD